MAEDKTKEDTGFFIRSDGMCENGDGWFLVAMLTHSVVEGEFKVFRYKPSPTQKTVEVRWPDVSQFALFPQDVAVALVRRGFARSPSEEELAQIQIDAPEEPSPEGSKAPEDGEKVGDDLKIPSQPDPAENGRNAPATRGEPTETRKTSARKATKERFKPSTRKTQGD